ncbi:helix-turn-helix transcriptional regulator [Sphingomonas sp. HF-S3]|jgi:DNA-binding CsgD family transcriptional regulator|uniref:Helix-turn-helix transcriptional regulator n=1 Tax=Sphingomonas rustica TaxID=3103142 RepID=A0ABV0BC57_9SPHN
MNDATPPARLTERERDCLRLVSRGRSSKEIGAELGISHHTVDLHLRRAIRTLGASDRRDAARRLEAEEGGQIPYQQLSTQPQAIAEPPPITAISPPIRTDRQPRFRVPFLRQGRQYNDLTSAQRIGWTFAIAALMLIVIANFFNGLAALFYITG